MTDERIDQLAVFEAIHRAPLFPLAPRTQMGVLHRDIKPANFLMSSSGPGAIVKLADFGLSCFYRRGVPEKEPLGSPFYMAPEMVTRTKEGYGPAADIWSCGVCLFQFLSRDLPYKVRLAGARPLRRTFLF